MKIVSSKPPQAFFQYENEKFTAGHVQRFDTFIVVVKKVNRDSSDKQIFYRLNNYSIFVARIFGVESGFMAETIKFETKFSQGTKKWPTDKTLPFPHEISPNIIAPINKQNSKLAFALA